MINLTEVRSLFTAIKSKDHKPLLLLSSSPPLPSPCLIDRWAPFCHLNTVFTTQTSQMTLPLGP